MPEKGTAAKSLPTKIETDEKGLSSKSAVPENTLVLWGETKKEQRNGFGVERERDVRVREFVEAKVHCLKRTEKGKFET